MISTLFRPGTPKTNHLRLPDEISGYAFDPEYSWWSTVVAEASRNLIINPSFEVLAATEYSASDWSASSYEEFVSVGATAGRRCAQLTMGASEAYLEYDEGLTVAAGPYTFSLDVYAPHVGAVVILQIRNSSTVLARRSITFDRVGWQRLDISYVESGSGTRQVRLVSPTTNPSGTVLYTDAWQFEAKAYPTTYLDGDMIGFNDTRPNESYYWLGAPHASPSARRATTGSGGRVISWSHEAGFKTTSIVGLGMATTEPRVQVLADGTEVHRGSAATARSFTIIGRIFGRSAPEIIARHKSLVDLLRPNNTLDGEQTILRYQYVNAVTGDVGPILDIACAYNSGLEGAIQSLYQETLPIQFRSSQPFPVGIIDRAAEIALSKSLVGNSIIFKDEDGDYVNLGAGSTNAAPLRVGFMRDGTPVAFGPFDSLAGDTVSDAAYWDGDSWVQLGELARSASDVDDGYRSGYPLTISTTTGDVVEYDEDTDTWTDLGDGFTGSINGISRDPEGNIWVAGTFEFAADGVTTYNNVAKWDIATQAWQALGTGLTDPGELNPTVEALTVLADDDGYVYFGGWFEQGDSGATTTLANSVIRWNPVDAVWEGMGSGFDAAPTKLIRGRDGYIYAVGTFSQNGTEVYDLRGFARWNGYQWEEVFKLVKQDGSYGADGVTLDEDGIFWFFNYVTDPDTDLFVVPGIGEVGTFGWKDGVFYPSIGSVSITHLAIGPGNRTIYAVRGIDGEDTYSVPALNEIEYEGSADAPLVFHTDGVVMPVQCLNLSAKGGVYFRGDFITGEHEHLLVRSDMRRALVYSSARFNLTKFVSSGATNFRALRLRPGTNRISVYAKYASDDAVAWMTWRDRVWGLE